MAAQRTSCVYIPGWPPAGADCAAPFLSKGTQEAPRICSPKRNDIFPWVRHCFPIHTWSTYYLPCELSRRTQMPGGWAHVHTHCHTHPCPEGGGQSGARCWRGRGLCVLLYCLPAWGALWVSHAQTTSAGTEEEADSHRFTS